MRLRPPRLRVPRVVPGTLWLFHQAGQVGRDDRKRDEDREADAVHPEEGQYAAKNGAGADLFIWTARASDIPAKVAKARARLYKLQSA